MTQRQELQIADASSPDYGQVSDAPTGTGYTAVAAGVGVGGFHSCALTSSGAIECWGYDNYGQVSDAP